MALIVELLKMAIFANTNLFSAYAETVYKTDSDELSTRGEKKYNIFRKIF